MARKPSINTSPVASHYASPGERIIEYSSEAGGGLVSFRVLQGDTGADRLAVHLYRQDQSVMITAGPADGMTAPRPGDVPAAPPPSILGYPIVAFLPVVRADRHGRPGQYRAGSARAVPGEWIVVAERGDPDLAGQDTRYCTGSVFCRRTGDGPEGSGPWEFLWERGEYDLTLPRALAGLAERAQMHLLAAAGVTP